MLTQAYTVPIFKIMLWILDEYYRQEENKSNYFTCKIVNHTITNMIHICLCRSTFKKRRDTKDTLFLPWLSLNNKYIQT